MSQPADHVESGATVVITHRVRSDRHVQYEEWLREITPRCMASPGSLDWHIVRPILGLSETFTIIIRFDTTEHLRNWMESDVRGKLIEQVKPLLVGEDDFYISSGLDFWFTPAGAKAKLPVRWKQYLLTWSAIYPLALCVPFGIVPLLKLLGLPMIAPLTTFAVTTVVVFLMVYVVMPRYTRLVRRWLFK